MIHPWRIPGDAWLDPAWNTHMDAVIAAVKAEALAELECDESGEASGEVA